jgi:hypothetical protein
VIGLVGYSAFTVVDVPMLIARVRVTRAANTEQLLSERKLILMCDMVDSFALVWDKMINGVNLSVTVVVTARKSHLA